MFVVMLNILFTGVWGGLTPGGKISCVTEVESGSEVVHLGENGGGFQVTNGKGTFVIPPCSSKNKVKTESFVGGWQVYTKQNVEKDEVLEFTSRFNVPDAPKKYKGQTIFLFP